MPVTKMAGRLQNLGSWLVEAVALEIEILIIHDHRDHETQTELEALCANFPDSRIFLHSGQFGSPGAARNFGLELSTSKYVVFWDADDLPKPQDLVGEVISKDGTFDVLVGQYLVQDREKYPSASRKFLDLDLKAIAYNPGLWRMVFLRGQFSDIEFEYMKMGEDQVYLMECLMRTKRISFTETLFYEYFIGVEGQLTGSRKSRNELGEAFDKVLKLRRITSDVQYQFLSIVLARMSLSLIKINLLESFRPRELKRIFGREILFPHRPFIQMKSMLYVCFRLVGAK